MIKNMEKSNPGINDMGLKLKHRARWSIFFLFPLANKKLYRIIIKSKQLLQNMIEYYYKCFLLFTSKSFFRIETFHYVKYVKFI